MKPSRVQIVIYLVDGVWVNCHPLKRWRTTKVERMQDKKKETRNKKNHMKLHYVYWKSQALSGSICHEERTTTIYFTQAQAKMWVQYVMHAHNTLRQAPQGIVLCQLCNLFYMWLH